MRSAIAIIASTALFVGTVDAHGYIHEPKPKFKNGEDTKYSGLIDANKLPAPFAGKKWNGDPDGNVATFTEAFKASNYKTLKALADETVKDCGSTLTDGEPVDVSNMKELKWGNDQEKKGFVTSHSGPCEVWIDDTQVMHEDNCVKKFPDYPAKIPVDYSKCKGKCTLTFYWLALHEPNWQVYKQCVSIKNGAGGGGGGGGSTSPSPSGSSSPAPGTPAPSGSTPGSASPPPSGSPAPSGPGGPTPAPSTKTPSPAPKSNCTKKPKTRRGLRNN